MRIKKGFAAHRKHYKIRKATEGMQHGRRRGFRLGKQAVIRALEYATRDRRSRKRNFRSLWITRINSAAHQHGLSYGTFINGLKKSNITLDRKILSEIAVHHPDVFKALAQKIK